MEILAGLVTKMLPTQKTNIEVKEKGDTVTASVGNFSQVRSVRLKNEAGQPVTLQNTGIAMTFQFDNLQQQLAPSSMQWSDLDMPLWYKTKSGTRATFNWRG